MSDKQREITENKTSELAALVAAFYSLPESMQIRYLDQIKGAADAVKMMEERKPA